MRALFNSIYQNGFWVVGTVGLLATFVTLLSPLPALLYLTGIAAVATSAMLVVEFFRRNPMMYYRGDSQPWFWLRMSLTGIFAGYFAGSFLKIIFVFWMLPLLS